MNLGMEQCATVAAVETGLGICWASSNVTGMLRIVATLLAVCTIGCSRKTPEEQLLKAIDPAAAWVPSLQMTAEKWSANSVPSSFARSSAEAAEKAFEKAKKAAAKSSASSDLRSRVTRDLERAAAVAEQMARAAERNDRRVVPAATGSLREIRSDFDALEKQYGGAQ